MVKGCSRKIPIGESYWYTPSHKTGWMKITNEESRICMGIADRQDSYGTLGRLCMECAVKAGIVW